jgi:uncharacterized protein YlxW (UPF0749 family)
MCMLYCRAAGLSCSHKIIKTPCRKLLHGSLQHGHPAQTLLCHAQLLPFHAHCCVSLLVLLLLLQGSVQEQLEALCDSSPVCAPAQARRQREANKQLRVDNRSLRIQLQRSQAQVQQLQRQLKAAQAAGQKD